MPAVASTMKESDVAEAAAVAAPPAKRSKKKLVIILLVLAAIAGGGGYWYSTQHKSAAAHGEISEHGAAAGHGETEVLPGSKSPAIYLPLQPAFVVNLNDTEAMRYLQVDMEVMARNPKTIEDAKLHMPRIRNSLLLLFGQQHAFDISTREGKEALQTKVLAEIQRVLKDETGSTGVEAVYFSSFVIQ